MLLGIINFNGTMFCLIWKAEEDHDMVLPFVESESLAAGLCSGPALSIGSETKDIGHPCGKSGKTRRTNHFIGNASLT